MRTSKSEARQDLLTSSQTISTPNTLPMYLSQPHQEPIQRYLQGSRYIQPWPLLNQEGNQETNAGRTHQAPIALPIF